MNLHNNKLFSTLLYLACIAILQCAVVTPSHAVMPAKHYDEAARASKIKAIAVVEKIEIVEESKRATRKRVTFRLERALSMDTPETFTGTCYSVDHAWQDTGVGGTIYYYPQEGTKVLVTVSSNGSLITSHTTLIPELEQEVALNGLRNISFGMGKASVKPAVRQGEEEQWFSFHVAGVTKGFFHAKQKRNREQPMLIEFTQELLVGEIDGDRQLYTVTTQSREDDTLTPEWLDIEVTEFGMKKTTKLMKRKVGFRVTGESNTQEGILVKGQEDAVDVAIPSTTTTDFLLFSLVEKMPFETGFSRSLNLIETLELHLKKNIIIRYTGRDTTNQNLHKFIETGSTQATYWLNDQHRLMEVHWDNDKVFKRTTEGDAMTILQ
ncbi:hypothetical protein F3F96_04700 [Mariprofundus sp. NF]|uniref:hypothetical protein n=1 Tax=Mariprofundus sp. NF TaxID=2608716 RepID=UPI0015A1ACC9|nr:hypothetical protein [Mariprofundus sp. NF]NWF38427.1 hypothetical protein [Mariprofundus sp. NF]